MAVKPRNKHKSDQSQGQGQKQTEGHDKPALQRRDGHEDPDRDRASELDPASLVDLSSGVIDDDDLDRGEELVDDGKITERTPRPADDSEPENR